MHIVVYHINKTQHVYAAIAHNNYATGVIIGAKKETYVKQEHFLHHEV